MVLVFRWPRGVGMVRKWKWYMLTKYGDQHLFWNACFVAWRAWCPFLMVRV